MLAKVLVDGLDVFAAGIGAVDEILLDVAVRGVVEHQAVRGGAVAAGAARLLIIRLDAAGNVVVDDEPHVGLVDAHAEGVGGHDDLAPALHEVVLGLAALRRATCRRDRRPCGGWCLAAMISATSSARLRVEV